jgi:hypothetical protein
MELMWSALFAGLVAGVFALVAACEHLLGKPPTARQ